MSSSIDLSCYRFFTHSLDAVLVTEPDGRVLMANAAACELAGRTELEIIMTGFRGLIDPESPELTQLLAQQQQTGKARGEVWLQHRDGSQIPVECSLVQLLDSNGSSWAVTTLRDLRAQKSVQESLRLSETKYRSVINAMMEGVVSQGADGRITAANPAALRILGRSLEHIVGLTANAPEWDAIREDGSPFAEEEQPALLTLRTGNSVENVVMGICRPDGERRWISITSAPIHSDPGAGLPSEVVSTFHDITEWRQRDAELLISATAFEHSLQAMMVTDARQRILRINSAFTRLTGYSEREVLGQLPSLLSSGRHDSAFYRDMWESLARDHYWQGEIWNRRSNGEVYPEWLSVTAVHNELNQLTHYIGIFSDLSEHKRAEEAIHTLSFYDPLTSLPNRRMFSDLLIQAIETQRLRGEGLALLLVNLDDFKAINEIKGIQTGDRVLSEVAQRLQACAKSSDLVARLGADEFALLVSHLSEDIAEAARQVEHLAIEIQQELQQVGGAQQVPPVSVSIGISLVENGKLSRTDLMRRADAALSQARQSGRGAVHFFDAAMQARRERSLALLSRMRQAVPSELGLHYQPQVNAQGHWIGLEALVRWHDPVRGTVSPAEFIPLAEESGLILTIGRWVLETACRQIRAWQEHPILGQLDVSVNVSALQFREPDFAQQVLGVLDSTGADPLRLKLELTESMLLDEVPAVVEKMSALRTHGVRFALDDFGTGFSSLSYLRRLPLDQLKIDQSFVRDLKHPDGLSIVRAVINLGASLGMEVIAEGVETNEQRKRLSLLNCQQFQGYLFASPLTAEALTAQADETGNARTVKIGVHRLSVGGKK